VLGVMNPEWTARIFEFDASRRSLVLGGKGLNNLKPQGSSTPLRWLKLHTLEVRDISFNQITVLADLPLVRLDIRGVRGEPYATFFERAQLLNEVVVKPGQLPAYVYKDMPPYITIVEESESL
jgi:hypothetical protein